MSDLCGHALLSPCIQHESKLTCLNLSVRDKTWIRLSQFSMHQPQPQKRRSLTYHLSAYQQKIKQMFIVCHLQIFLHRLNINILQVIQLDVFNQLSLFSYFMLVICCVAEQFWHLIVCYMYFNHYLLELEPQHIYKVCSWPHTSYTLITHSVCPCKWFLLSLYYWLMNLSELAESLGVTQK